MHRNNDTFTTKKRCPPLQPSVIFALLVVLSCCNGAFSLPSSRAELKSPFAMEMDMLGNPWPSLVRSEDPDLGVDDAFEESDGFVEEPNMLRIRLSPKAGRFSRHTSNYGSPEILSPDDIDSIKELELLSSLFSKADRSILRKTRGKAIDSPFSRSFQYTVTSELKTEISLENHDTVQYVGNIGIGTPPQLMTMVFDTGSPDLVVPSTRCVKCGGKQHRRYHADRSSTFQNMHSTFRDTYGSGQVSGRVAKESITIGSLTIRDVKFGQVDHEAALISRFVCDGIFGLSLGSLRAVTKPNVFTLLKEQYPHLNATFAFYLTPHKNQFGSELHVGGYDSRLLSNGATWHYNPVIALPHIMSMRYWAIFLGEFTVRGVDVCAREGCYAIVDTGSSLIGIPDREHSVVMSQVKKGKRCPHERWCIGVGYNSFPSLTVSFFDKTRYVLTPRDYLICYIGNICRIQIQKLSGYRHWIIGNVFLKSYYTIFDATNLRVGFACKSDARGMCRREDMVSSEALLQRSGGRINAVAAEEEDIAEADEEAADILGDWKSLDETEEQLLDMFASTNTEEEPL